MHYKKINKVIAAFNFNTIITEMNVLLILEAAFLLTTKKDIFREDPNREVFLRYIPS